MNGISPEPEKPKVLPRICPECGEKVRTWIMVRDQKTLWSGKVEDFKKYLAEKDESRRWKLYPCEHISRAVDEERS